MAKVVRMVISNVGGIQKNQKCNFEFTSGIKVEGVLKNLIRQDGKLLILSFENCKVSYFGRVLFELK